MTTRLESVRRFFDIRPGEGRAVVVAFLFVALAVASFLLAKPIRNGLFLAEYGAYKLVYVYVAVPVVVSIALSIYTRIAARFGERTLFIASLLFFALNVVAFWYLFRFRNVPGLPAIFYVWVNCFGIIAPVQAWTFANGLFDSRQARRLFGFVGSGASLGAISGGLLARELVPRLGTVNLLLVLAAMILLAALVVATSYGVRGPERRDTPAESLAPTLRESIALVRGSRYLTQIAAMVFLVAIVTQWTQFQFSLAAEARFAADPDRLTRLFGTFNFVLGLVALGIQLFATGPSLRRFGVQVTILILPFALVMSSLATVIAPVLATVVITNAIDQAFRFSIDKATFELLYLPLPAGVKTGVKGVIDVIVNRIGDGIGGVALGVATQGFSLWFVTLPGAGLGLRGLAAITAVLSALWLLVAFSLRNGYVEAITESIHQHRLEIERAAAPVLDRSVTSALANRFEHASEEAILYALDQLESAGQLRPHPAVRALVTHPSARVRARAVALLNAAGDRTMAQKVEPLLKDPDLEVRTEALLYLAYHAGLDPLARIEALGDFPDFSIRAGMVAFLSRPGRLQNLEAARVILDAMVYETGPAGRRARIEAATLLSRLPDEFGAELAHLVQDPDPDVAVRAIEAVGTLRRRDLAHLVIPRLAEAPLRDAAADALVKLGPSVLPQLGSALADHRNPSELRREVPDVIARIGTLAGQRLLVDNLLEQDVTVRLRVIGALNSLHKLHPGVPINRQAVEMVLMAEIMGHYRSYQILGTLGETFDGSDPLAAALSASMEQEIERIFRLMSLRWPDLDMHSAYVGLKSESPAVRANALEFLENTLKPQVRNLVVPLLDSQVSRLERVNLANRLLGTSVDTQEQAVAALLASEDPWLRSCGVYAVGMLRLTSLAPELDRLATDADPLLQETIRDARQRLAGEEPEAAPDRHRGVRSADRWQGPRDTMGVG